MESSDFPDEVAKLCYKHFKKLPKKGKPQGIRDWTLLACIAMSKEYPKRSLKVITLTTGTKCLGFSQLSDKGDVLFDSHAEVLARRSFIKFMMHHMLLVLHKNDSEILTYNETDKKFNLRPGIAFHLFVSHVPCGDAAIFPKNPENEENSGELVQGDCEENPSKKLKLDISNELDNSNNNSSYAVHDIYRTGAKCVDGDVQDPKMPGKDFHVIGALRTKPGRGDPTWSMSCSDKIALWNVCGIQGALLSSLLEAPVYLSSIIFGKCPFDSKAIQRAVIERISDVTFLPSQYYINKPMIFQSTIKFEFSKGSIEDRIDCPSIACPMSIIWCDIPGFLEVAVNGRKQGFTKKNINKPSARVSICKSMLLEKFQEIIQVMSEDFTQMPIEVKDNFTYLDYKHMAKSYQEAKSVFWKIFSTWKRKPDNLQKFIVLRKKNE
ncbi:tRNA-specific adenosine deaminase 1 like protein [Argiope bruennichi]|uniref:tRNA-specific adenosine deaminase 1 n=1 Tax=Argiope bruennichi TaxID=94029 RepID=A0A8T0EJ44_ARGBR|nr:tRNA-specific adenosine deaminase 1 like protein [Argiope bruennichi]